MDVDAFFLAVSASITSHLVVLGFGAIGVGLMSWLFHTKKMQALRDDIEGLKSQSGSPVIHNIINNMVPQEHAGEKIRADRSNEFIEFGTIGGDIKVHRGEFSMVIRDVVRGLHKAGLIAPLVRKREEYARRRDKS